VTGLLRAEHRAIRGLVDLMEREIANPEAPAELARAALRRLLAAHALKEDHVLYPAIDRLLSAEESDRTVARIQSWTLGDFPGSSPE
jgi:hemerythrin-like domain-containing protein